MTDIIVTFLLDESGSMGPIRQDTIGGFNTYISTLRNANKQIDFTLIKFDSQDPYNVVFKGKRITDVPLLTEASYAPRGGTPLIDAAYKTIQGVEDALKWHADNKPKVLVVIQTDGQENSSTQHTTQQLKVLIEQKQGQGWEFVFMGAGVDAYAQAGSYGINMGHTASYARGQSIDAFANLASNTATWTASGMSDSLNYSDTQKMAQGDAFDAKLNNSKTRLRK